MDGDPVDTRHAAALLPRADRSGHVCPMIVIVHGSQVRAIALKPWVPA